MVRAAVPAVRGSGPDPGQTVPEDRSLPGIVSRNVSPLLWKLSPSGSTLLHLFITLLSGFSYFIISLIFLRSADVAELTNALTLFPFWGDRNFFHKMAKKRNIYAKNVELFFSRIKSSVHISVETLHFIIIYFQIDLFLFSFLLYSIGCWVPKLRCASFAPVLGLHFPSFLFLTTSSGLVFRCYYYYYYCYYYCHC
jgi:hypothetical protein